MGSRDRVFLSGRGSSISSETSATCLHCLRFTQDYSLNSSKMAALMHVYREIGQSERLCAISKSFLNLIR